MCVCVCVCVCVFLLVCLKYVKCMGAVVCVSGPAVCVSGPESADLLLLGRQESIVLRFDILTYQYCTQLLVMGMPKHYYSLGATLAL